MSCLKLHWPQTLSLYRPLDVYDPEPEAGDDAPVILSFPRGAARSRISRQTDLLARARAIYDNRTCPICGRAAVVPVDDERSVMYANHMPVPGSGTLAGFACDCCGHTWDA